MIQFSCRFAFLSTFRLSNRTPKIARILTLYQANAATLRPLSKEDKILIKSLQECKGYNARQFIRVSEQRLDEEQHQLATGEVQNGQQASMGSGRRSAHTDENVDTVESLLLSQEDKPQSHQTAREISREAGYPSIISFTDYSQRSATQVLQEKARSTAD